jgi:hypothetical protein
MYSRLALRRYFKLCNRLSDLPIAPRTVLRVFAVRSAESMVVGTIEADSRREALPFSSWLSFESMETVPEASEEMTRSARAVGKIIGSIDAWQVEWRNGNKSTSLTGREVARTAVVCEVVCVWLTIRSAPFLSSGSDLQLKT